MGRPRRGRWVVVMTADGRSNVPALVDDATRERVRHQLDQTLFVEAGAGSGKTTLLVDRIVNLVLEGGAGLASIAAITFTQAAASELQSRVRARFENVQEQAIADGDEERAALCARAIADTDLAAITTLHGFANRILREFSVAAGLPPRVSVLDEVSSQLAHEDRWQRFLDRLYDTAEHERLLTLASALDIALEPRYVDQPTMRSVAAEFNQNWDRLDPIIAADVGSFEPDSFALFDEAVERVVEHVGLCADPSDLLATIMREAIPGLLVMQKISDPDRKLRILASPQSKIPTGGGRGKANAWGGKDGVAEARGVMRAVEDARLEVVASTTDRVLLRVSQLVAADVVDAATARRVEGGLEFHDLLVLARNMLRTKDEVRAALHDRYRYLLLDEFQDTDPIQVELAVLIATHADEVANVPWHHLPVGPGRLFFVGDPKQSIYRFRRADIALFLQARDAFAGDDGAEQLRTNFRTVEPILDWVNALFADEMAEGTPGAQPAYEPLSAHRAPATDEQRLLHRPVLLGRAHDDPDLRAPDLRSLEAADVTGAIRAIIADPDQWPVLDESTGSWRPARLDDITILLPTRTSLPFLRAALDEAELRYRIVTGTLVYDTQEVNDALAAVRAVDDPTDHISLITALRSPLYGCADTELLEWRNAGGHWDYRRPAPAPLGDQHRVAQAFAHLYGLWQQRWFLTPSSLLDRLLRERHARLLAFGDTRPTDVWRRLRFLVEQARLFEESGSGDLRAFCDWAGMQAGSMARVHEPLLPETDETAVSIQTIHGAKGLEFPITILSGMTTQLRGVRAGVAVTWPDVGPPSVKLRKGLQTLDHQPRADLEAAMDVHEKLRLAYVATTRARDHLLVSCHHKVSKTGKIDTYAGQFWRAFDREDRRDFVRPFDWAEVAGRLPDEVPAPAQLGLALDDREQWQHQRAALLDPFATPRVLSATGIAQQAQAAEAQAERMGFDQDDDRADQLDDDGPIQRRRGRVGSAVGSAVHAVLQVVDLAAPQDIEDHVSQQCQVESIPDLDRVVRRLVDAALGSTAVELAAAHPHHKELFVAAPLHDRVIEGYVDLLVETPDGLVVVDYKTDSVSTDAEIDAKLAIYELQAAAYAVALETVTGQTVVECRFVFCRASGAVERTVADLPQAKQRVRDTLAGR